MTNARTCLPLRVYCYDTGERLDGAPTEALATSSRSAEPTGAVLAVRLESGAWEPIAESSKDTYRAMRFDVRTVYVQ